MKSALAVLLALAHHGCMPSDKPGTTSPVKETTVETTLSDPFEGVFPPRWRIGDRWRVTMSTEMPDKTGSPKRFVRDRVFEFRVEEEPAGDDGFFLVRIKSAGPAKVNWVGKYRKKPFSFVRLEDERGEAVPWHAPDNGESPVVGVTPEGYLKDFPIMPSVTTLGITPFVVDRNTSIAQDIARTPEGLRFTLLLKYQSRATIEWKRGAPWWSSVEWSEPLGDPPFPSGRLLPPEP